MDDYSVMTDEQKTEIDSMSRYAMCSMWRFAPSGSPLIMGACGDYFKKRLFDELGGFSPEISKALS